MKTDGTTERKPLKEVSHLQELEVPKPPATGHDLPVRVKAVAKMPATAAKKDGSDGDGDGGAPSGIRASFLSQGTWDRIDSDGNLLEGCGEGPTMDLCRGLGTAEYVDCPAGTREALKKQNDGANAEEGGAVAATLKCLTQNVNSRREDAPKFLVLFGSLREASTARKLAIEVARILTQYGAEVKFFDPHGLPLFNEDIAPSSEPKVMELHTLLRWCEGMVWVSPEYHGTISGVMKNQVDWMPLSVGGIRPTQGKTLAVMQVEGGSQSFNTVLAMRALGRWMRLVCIPNQVSVPRAQLFFDEGGKMLESSFRSRVVDVCDELYKFTLLLRGQNDYLLTRYSESQKSFAKITGAQENPGAG